MPRSSDAWIPRQHRPAPRPRPPPSTTRSPAGTTDNRSSDRSGQLPASRPPCDGPAAAPRLPPIGGRSRSFPLPSRAPRPGQLLHRRQALPRSPAPWRNPASSAPQPNRASRALLLDLAPQECQAPSENRALSRSQRCASRLVRPAQGGRAPTRAHHSKSAEPRDQAPHFRSRFPAQDQSLLPRAGRAGKAAHARPAGRPGGADNRSNAERLNPADQPSSAGGPNTADDPGSRRLPSPRSQERRCPIPADRPGSAVGPHRADLFREVGRQPTRAHQPSQSRKALKAAQMIAQTSHGQIRFPASRSSGRPLGEQLSGRDCGLRNRSSDGADPPFRPGRLVRSTYAAQPS
jgi:hypothetical protein